MIRVEEGLFNINKNFEILSHQIDKPFTWMFAFMSIIFTVLGVLMTVYKFID